MKYKESLEKERLRNRSGGFHRYENVPNPIDVTKDCPSYIGGRDRMTSGARIAEAMLKERMIVLQVRDERTERRRARSYCREDARWRAIDANERAIEDRDERLRADPMIGRKNVKGVPCDPVNHVYDMTPQGKQLEHHDNMIRYRGEIRKAHLAVRQHLGFNPITGEQANPIRVPKPPRPHPLAFGDSAPYASYP